MKGSVLAARAQLALERLVAAGERLAHEAGTDPPNLQIPKGDTAHQQMFLLEALADFMESLVMVDDPETETAVSDATPAKKKPAKKGA